MAVVRLEVTRRERVLGGAAFGAGGPYEKIEGVLHFAVDPSARVHEPIADLARAPRNARGLVESSADFYLLRPLTGSRRLLLDIPNRGRKIALGMFNSTPRSLPFARTAAERGRTGDPRPSLEERYGDRDRYLARVRRDAEAMVADRHLLAEDVDAVVERAGALWDFVCPR